MFYFRAFMISFLHFFQCPQYLLIIYLSRETIPQPRYLSFHSSGTQVSDKVLWNSTQEILYVQNSLFTLKDTSFPYVLKIFHRIIISVEICICLLPWFVRRKLTESCNSQGDNERSNHVKSQMRDQKVSSKKWTRQFFFSTAQHHGLSILIEKWISLLHIKLGLIQNLF